MREITVIAHNLRSTHNVGSLLRTCEGLGVQHVYLTGYTPYPAVARDSRLPHIAAKLTQQINKTALGAETQDFWEHREDIFELLDELKEKGFHLTALEQSTDSMLLPTFTVPDKVALIVGREVEGIEQDVLAASQTIVEIPMFGQKESFNVVQAAAMALYHYTFVPFTMRQ